GAQDPEMFEITTPSFIETFEYATDSAGPGEWRGGLGVQSVFHFTTHGIQASSFGDGAQREFVARGSNGGLPGSINLIDFQTPDGEKIQPKNKDLVSGLPAGTIFRQLAGGGGGFGDPHQRPAERVAEEVVYCYVSVESAKRDYG